jgi:hypothetical protein
MHFDSDETNLNNGGKANHPLYSCVLFIDAEVGGPTLITNQTLGKLFEALFTRR